MDGRLDPPVHQSHSFSLTWINCRCPCGSDAAAELYGHARSGCSKMNLSLLRQHISILVFSLWGRPLCLLLSIVMPVTCSALEIRRVQTCSGIVLRLRGDI